MSKIKAFKKKRQKAKSVKEGAKEYVPEIRIQAMLKTTFMTEPSKTLSSPARTGTMTTACTARLELFSLVLRFTNIPTTNIFS